MKKIEVRNLSVEITRRCNMRCPHCMRGDAQDVDISHVFINDLFSKIGYINYFTITGGEPSMNVNGIRYILRCLKKWNIKVYKFYIITNGSRSSILKPFIDICAALYDYQQAKELAPDDKMLQMSNDKYHDESFQEKVFKKLSQYPFFGNRFKNTDNYFLIKQGRSKSGNEMPAFSPYIAYDNVVTGDIYLNALGYIIEGGDLSYENQDSNILTTPKRIINYLISL